MSIRPGTTSLPLTSTTSPACARGSPGPTATTRPWRRPTSARPVYPVPASTTSPPASSRSKEILSGVCAADPGSVTSVALRAADRRGDGQAVEPRGPALTVDLRAALVDDQAGLAQLADEPPAAGLRDTERLGEVARRDGSPF